MSENDICVARVKLLATSLRYIHASGQSYMCVCVYACVITRVCSINYDHFTSVPWGRHPPVRRMPRRSVSLFILWLNLTFYIGIYVLVGWFDLLSGSGLGPGFIAPGSDVSLTSYLTFLSNLKPSRIVFFIWSYLINLEF